MSRSLRLCLLPLAALFLAAAPVVSPTPEAAPGPTPYPVSSIITEADKALTVLSEIRGALGSDGLSDSLARLLPKLTLDVDANEAETARILDSPARIGTLQELTTKWSILRENASVLSGLVNDRLGRFDEQSALISSMTAQWKATQGDAGEVKIPADLQNRISTVLEQTAATRKAIDDKRTALLRYQGRLADQSARIGKTLGALEQARGDALDRLFVRDEKPLWKIPMTAGDQATPAAEEISLSGRMKQIGEFLYRERGKILLHLAVWLFLAGLFRRARVHVRKWTEADPSLLPSTAIFEVPVATATLLVLWFSPALYPAAPPLLLTLVSAALLIPLFFVVRKLIERPLLPITWALAVFFLTSQIRDATAVHPWISRLVYLAEALGGVVFCLWLIRTSRFSAKPETGRQLLWKIVRSAASLGLLVFAVAGIANLIGYVNLSLFVGGLALQCAYLGILLYAGCHIVEGLVTFALKIPPLALLSMVRHHRPLLERRIRRALRFAAGLLWVVFTLDKMSLLHETLAALSGFFAVRIAAEVTVGGVITFLLTIWASFLLSRFIRFLLEEDVYRRVRLKAGLPFAISTLLHYAILLLGFYIAMAALLGDISKFTVLAGAFGVGLAFGLQNIVNNFVSSLIVLFERPVKIGDLIEIGGLQGTVRQIGIRATIIRTAQGSEIIIPNAKLISDPVINWTLTSQQRLVALEITTVSAGVDPQKVITLLEASATARPEITTTPPPEAVLTKFAAASLTFELRVWTGDLPHINRLRSDLSIAINEALAKEGIAVA